MGISSNEKITFVFLLSCYQHCDLVGRCVAAIKNQTYKNVNVFFAEDTPGGCDYHEISWIYSYRSDNKHLGQITRLNQSLDTLFNYDYDGKIYVNFHGVDDHLFHKDVLKELAWRIKINNYLGWCYGRSNRQRTTPAFDRTRLLRGNYIAGGAVFVDLELYRQAGYFRKLTFARGGDWDMWLRLSRICKPITYNLPIYCESIGTSKIRSDPRKFTTKIYNRIKYPILRIERGFRRTKQPRKQS